MSFQLRLDPRLPEYAACSMECLDGIALIAMENNGVVNKSEMEAQAIRDARLQLAAVLTEIGVLDAFNGCTANEIDTVIERVWDGLRVSMQRQSVTGDVPF